MFSKLKFSFAFIALTGVLPISALANAPETAKESQNTKLNNEQHKQVVSCKNDECYTHSRIQIGPYLEKNRLFDGSELLINMASMREDANLLLQQYKIIKDSNRLGIPLPEFPRMILSGEIEALYTHSKPYVGKTTDDFTFDTAEIDFLMQANAWLSGYVAIDYYKPPGPGETKSSVFMNRAFITLGNLAVSPFYVSAGKEYVPFGRYSSSMINSPYTLALGRTLANTLLLGYQQTGDNALYAQAYIYQGKTHYASNKEKNHLEFGGDTGLKYKAGPLSGEFGAGVISNLADSQGMHGTFFNNSTTFITQRIPAGDVYGSITIDQINFLAEYVTALKGFDKDNVAYEGKGAKPSAVNTELSYNFKSFNLPSSIALGYTSSSQALALGIPKESYRIVYNINIIRNTNLAIEYSHDINYSMNTAKGTNIDTSQLGKSADTVMAAFDYFF